MCAAGTSQALVALFRTLVPLSCAASSCTRANVRGKMRKSARRRSDLQLTHQAIILDCCDAHSTSEMGHSRRGRGDTKPGHVIYVPKAEVNSEHERLRRL